MNNSSGTITRLIGLGAVLLLTWLAAAAVPQLQILLPLARTDYQTNEQISLAVVRTDTAALPADVLQLLVTDTEGSKLTFTYSIKAIALTGNNAAATEHFLLNGWLLRPGKYTIQASAYGATASATFGVYSHMRKSSFRMINWGRATDPNDIMALSEDGMGYNLYYAHYGGHDQNANIRAGIDYMGCCVMGGAHQMDMKWYNDWSDPYVLNGAVTRVACKALIDRTTPNTIGVHFYDEPGLTWVDGSPHKVPAQKRSYKSAFGDNPISFDAINPNDANSVAQWKQWAQWKLAFMDGCWKASAFGVNQVRADYMTATQTQYGWMAFTDGIYYTSDRSLSVTSGHGGYDDYWMLTFNPSYFLEAGRARNFTRPNWYLPTWYGNTTTENVRLEQYLSFQTNIQGSISPPDLDPSRNATGRQGMVESNRLMSRLGTIFTTMLPSRGPVGVLYSLSDLLDEQTKDPVNVNYAHQAPHGIALGYTYLACKLIHQGFQIVLDEDIQDGTLAMNYKAIILPGITYLDPAVIVGLEQFVANGGTVILTANSTVTIKGAVKLTAPYDHALVEEKQKAKALSTGVLIDAVTPAAKEMSAMLDKVGIKPVFECDNPEVIVTRHAAGDIEYLFAVNSTFDAKIGTPIALKESSANLTFPADGYSVYDAVRGGTVAELKGNALKAAFRFGPGQMRAFARTARPIGGVQVATPVLFRDTTTTGNAPFRISFNATLVDNKNMVLSGSAPLEINVYDMQGNRRYNFFRATTAGICSVTIPLAANDPAGTWRVVVRELLANTEGASSFTYQPSAVCGPLMGQLPRAVFFADDREKVYRFFRTHKEVTIATGANPAYEKAAQRLVEVLGPWGVKCTVVPAADLNKPRVLTPEEAVTWTGLREGAQTPDKATKWNAGLNVLTNTVLLGTPTDNPLIGFLQETKVLPYALTATFPGSGHGMIAWSSDILSVGYESIALIANDDAGMQEAIGTLYELAAGLTPVSPLNLPASSLVTPASPTVPFSTLATAWRVLAPDRVIGLSVNGASINAISNDGSLLTISDKGQLVNSKVVPRAEALEQAKTAGIPATIAAVDMELVKKLAVGLMPKTVFTAGTVKAVAFWGGRLVVSDANGTIKSQQQLPQDVTALATVNNILLVGLADGQILGLTM